MRRTVLSAVVVGAVTAALLVGAPAASAAGEPPNDDFNNGQVILSRGESVSGSNVNATAQSGEPNHADAMWQGDPLGATHSVWWSWTAATSGEARINTCNSDFDTRLAVYTGDALNSLQPVTAALDSNDGSCASIWAGVTFNATAGTTYRIAVDTEGDLNGDGSLPPWGNIPLTLKAPVGGEEPPPEDDTNPGTLVEEEPYTLKIPRFKPVCNEARTDSVQDCPRNATNLYFWSVEKHQTWEKRNAVMRKWVDTQRSKGADITFVALPKPSMVMDGTIMKYLRKQGVGGEVLTQNIAPGTKVTTTSDDPVVLKVGYFDPGEDQKILDATLAALEKAGADRKNVKSSCAFIDSNASFDMIETKLAEALGAGTLTQKRAGEILADYGCNYEVRIPKVGSDGKVVRDANGDVVSEPGYVDAPGLTTDTVLDVVYVNRDKDEPEKEAIWLKVGLPVSQDFAFVISDDVGSGPVTDQSPELRTLGLGLDSKLTMSPTQVNRITVQVLERVTGRLVPNVRVEFYDAEGNATTQTTDALGSTSFTPLFEREGRYALKASYTGGNGAKMTGFRSIDVVDRKGASFFTMSGQKLTWDGSYSGTKAGLQLARDLPILTANLGTGLTGDPEPPPVVRQIQASIPTNGGFITGQHNGVRLPNNSNYLVGSESGLITIGGGSQEQVGTAAGMRRRWDFGFEQAANWLVGVVSGIQKAFDTGEGTVAEKTSTADKQKIAETVDILVNNGAQPPGAGLISDKGLGLIGQAGGNLIGQAGGNCISVGGGNLISDKGLGRVQHGRAVPGINIGASNVISLEKDMMPVYGGNVIAVR